MPNLCDDGNSLPARPNVSQLCLRDWWRVGFHGEVQNVLTRPGPRDATIATMTLPPGSLQRMVELSRCAAGGKKKKGQAWGSMG